jgi:hypothetical protein
MLSRHCSSNNGNCQIIDEEFIWYIWSHIYNDVGAFFQWLESPPQAVSHHFTLTTQWLYHWPIHTTVRETDWLGYWLTPRGLILWKNKINAILHMDWPCNAIELCILIGYVNYYHTCHRVAHISSNRIDPMFDNLLHGQTKCRKHLYNAFAYDCKSIACPDHTKWFSIHTNASDFQLGMCVSSKIEGRLPTSLAIWWCHSKIILHWNSKYFPS